MAKRLFKSSVPEETTNGVKHFKNRILAKFCAFFLAFTASSSAVVIAFQMASTTPVVAISKVQGLKDTVSSPVTNLLMNPTEDYDSGKNFLDEATQSAGANGSFDNLSTTFTHHTTGDSDFSHTINWTSRWSPEMGSSSQMEVFSGNNAAPFSLDLTFELERYLGGSWYAVKQGHIAIQDIYDWTWSRPNIDWNLGGLSLDAISHALAVGGRNIRGAEATVNGMVQNAVSMLKVYNDSKVKRIIASTSIKLDDSKPQAIFLIVPDEEKSKNGFISLFVAETYKELIRMATNNENKKLKHPLYYILDEFGNIPKIPNLDSMVTVSASRNIFFMFILQNYKQINESYGPNIASIIMGNCGYEFYLLTNDHETAEAFSKKMGDREIQKVSKSSSKNDKGFSSSTSISDQTRRLIHADELMKLKEGEIIVAAQRLNPIKTSLAPFWEFKGFVPGKLEISKTEATASFDAMHVYNFVTPTDAENEKEQGTKQELVTDDSISTPVSDDELVNALKDGQHA